ncbi:MAG: AbrB/MazE/SpoVT family DNA-binding domain-containing protein [Candidatus Omnitrophota bacterium]|jgi:AbrB family looped-hinge helix DNA binding protein
MGAKSKIWGIVKVGKRGQAVIPFKLRKSFNIQPKDRLVVFVDPDKNVINLMPDRCIWKAQELL